MEPIILYINQDARNPHPLLQFAGDSTSLARTSILSQASVEGRFVDSAPLVDLTDDFLAAVNLMARGFSPFLDTANVYYRYNEAGAGNVKGWSFFHVPNDTSALVEFPNEIPRLVRVLPWLPFRKYLLEIRHSTGPFTATTMPFRTVHMCR